MPFYSLIANRLALGTKETFQRTDIIEYMVLEAADCLVSMQNMPLQCRFDYNDQLVDADTDISPGASIQAPRSYFKLTLDPSASNNSAIMLKKFYSVKHKFLKNIRDAKEPEAISSDDFTDRRVCFRFSLSNVEIEQAIKSSSLYVAAGDLSQFHLSELLLLKHRLRLHTIFKPAIAVIANHLINRVNLHLATHFSKTDIEQCSIEITKEFDKKVALSWSEQQFDVISWNLSAKIHELTSKAQERFTVGEESYSNDDYDPNYQAVGAFANTLYDSLSTAKQEFYTNNPTQQDLDLFNQRCHAAINSARNEFAKFRQGGAWYSELHPFFQGVLDVCKALAGIIAGATIVPALLVETYSQNGYVGTFFQTPKTDALQKLEEFEQGISGEYGLINNLNRVLARG